MIVEMKGALVKWYRERGREREQKGEGGREICYLDISKAILW